MSFSLRIDGYPATEIAAHTPPTYETWADGGCGSMTWAFAMSAVAQHQALRAGALVELMCGPLPLWSGLLSDPDRTTGECSAYGLAADAQNYLALGSGTTTRDLLAAISEAIVRGWRVTNPSPVAGTAAGDASGNPISVSQLITEYCEQTGQRWGVDHGRRVFVRPDPTTPSWVAAPGSVAFGSTGEDRAVTLYARYLNIETDLYSTASVGSGVPEVDAGSVLVDRGAMSPAAALAVLNGLLGTKYGGPAWTNGVTLHRDQLMTLGGTPAFLPAVRAGQSLRALGLPYIAQALALDTVIGKTSYTVGEDVIYLEPVNTAPRNFTDVTAAA